MDRTFHACADEHDLKAAIPCPKLWPALERAEAILRAVPEITVREVQVQKGCSRVALYILLRESPEAKILNFTLTGPSRFQVEFRFPEHLPESVRDKLPAQTLKVRYASGDMWPLDELVRVVRDYVEKIGPAVVAGVVAQGSDPERRVHALLKSLVSGAPIHKESCPPCVREHVGAPVRFDFFLPTLGANGVAVEVEGPGHVLPIRGEEALLRGQERDKAKDDACERFGIGLVRIRADAKDRLVYTLIRKRSLARLCLSA